MTRRDEPTPAGENRGRSRTGRGRRRGGARGGRVTADQSQSQSRLPAEADAGRSNRSSRLRRVEEVSAGGLVVRHRDDEVLGVLIAKHDRRGRLVWSLPKGHVEDGETLEQTAAREVQEETGVTGEVVGALGEVDYWFVFGGRKVHKTVHHFLLQWTAGELSDRDVEVVEVAWVPLADIPDRLAYPDERRLMRQVHDLLAKSA